MENKRRIDRETVVNALQLYDKEKLPSRQVAKLIRISPTQTKRILKDAGVIRTP
ncbi:unnamed protein product, partial [marine sediment metagenome]